MERESMEFDVVIVGAGPAGLAAACHLKQLCADMRVCVVEKGASIGSHIVSGATFEANVLDGLFPDWRESDAPVTNHVTQDEILFLHSHHSAQKIPSFFIPQPLRNHGNYIISVGALCVWLGKQAEALGIDIFTGFAASELLFDEDNAVKGILVGDMGLDKHSKPKDNYMEGIALFAKYTVLAEGCRGHLGKQLIAKYQLNRHKTPQHYALGFKEIWSIPEAQHQQGKVLHTLGWPLINGVSGGGFLYHLENNQVAVGLIVDLNYKNPYLSPFDEFQRYKTHPAIAKILSKGERLSYGAKAITKGGMKALPKMSFPGGLLIGCDAGTLNFAKIKGTHTAIKSGMLAAKAIANEILNRTENQVCAKELTAFDALFKASSLYQELYQARNFGAAIQQLGTVFGGVFNYVDQNWFKGQLPFKCKDKIADYQQLKNKGTQCKIAYPKPDNKLSFDRLSSVYLANLYHDEDQPCHLTLKDQSIPISVHVPQFDEPAQRYCPAGVYEIVEQDGDKKFVINGQNCIHCKTCDIKDPSQNITWQPPEGGSGPNYNNM